MLIINLDKLKISKKITNNMDLVKIWNTKHDEILEILELFDLEISEKEDANFIKLSKFLLDDIFFSDNDKSFVLSGNFDDLMYSTKFPREFRVQESKVLLTKYKYNSFGDESEPLDPINYEPIPEDKIYILNDCYYNIDSLAAWVKSFNGKSLRPTDPRTRDLLDENVIKDLYPNFDNNRYLCTCGQYHSRSFFNPEYQGGFVSLPYNFIFYNRITLADQIIGRSPRLTPWMSVFDDPIVYSKNELKLSNQNIPKIFKPKKEKQYKKREQKIKNDKKPKGGKFKQSYR